MYSLWSFLLVIPILYFGCCGDAFSERSTCFEALDECGICLFAFGVDGGGASDFALL